MAGLICIAKGFYSEDLTDAAFDIGGIFIMIALIFLVIKVCNDVIIKLGHQRKKKKKKKTDDIGFNNLFICDKDCEKRSSSGTRMVKQIDYDGDDA